MIALDVGYGQLHPRLRADDRVTVLERVNARNVTSLPFPRSWSSATSRSSREDGPAAASRPRRARLGGARAREAAVRGGQGRRSQRRRADPEVRRRVLLDVCSAAAGWGSRVAGVVDSGLPGPKGNREYLVHLTRAGADRPR